MMNRIEGTHTVANERRDFAEWHLGRAPFVFWALDVANSLVAARVARAAAQLEGYLLSGYDRQAHVTLDLCGFPDPAPLREDEFDDDFLSGQCAALQAAGIPEFDIEIGGPGSFSSAPFLQVLDPGGHIAAIRQCLAVDGEARLFGDYVPHVTVGLYGGAWPLVEIAACMSRMDALERTVCRVERVSLMAYEPSVIGGPLRCVADYWLASGKLDWRTLVF